MSGGGGRGRVKGDTVEPLIKDSSKNKVHPLNKDNSKI